MLRPLAAVPMVYRGVSMSRRIDSRGLRVHGTCKYFQTILKIISFLAVFKMLRSVFVVIMCLTACASAQAGTLHASGPEQDIYNTAAVSPDSAILKDSQVQPSAAANLAHVDVKVRNDARAAQQQHSTFAVVLCGCKLCSWKSRALLTVLTAPCCCCCQQQHSHSQDGQTAARTSRTLSAQPTTRMLDPACVLLVAAQIPMTAHTRVLLAVNTTTTATASKNATTSKNATMEAHDDHDDHTGHDHSHGHDDSNKTTSATAKPAPSPAPKRSAAAVASAGVGLVVAALAMLLM